MVAYLNGILDNETGGEDGLMLANAMGPINGLHLSRWVPPWILRECMARVTVTGVTVHNEDR